jgi:hypothetical protein
VLICIPDFGVIVGRAGGELIRRVAARSALGAGLVGLILGVFAALPLVMTFFFHVGSLPAQTSEKPVPQVRSREFAGSAAGWGRAHAAAKQLAQSSSQVGSKRAERQRGGSEDGWRVG